MGWNMSGNKVKIEQDDFDNPLRVKLGGMRSWVLLMLVATIALNTCGTELNTRASAEFQRKQYELARRQYTLDSLRFVQSQNQK